MQLLISHMHVQSSLIVLFIVLEYGGYREHLQRQFRLIFLRQNVRFVYLG